MNICIFCSAQDVGDKYTKPAGELATLLATQGHTLIWGGTNVGTMKVIADAAQAAGGRIEGISMEILKHKARKNADVMEFAKDLAERKAFMLERSDAIIVLPGGIGTLDEATDVIAIKRHKLHDKPVLFLNIDGFYDGLKAQLERMDREGFLADRDGDVLVGLDTLVYFAQTPHDALAWIETHAAKKG